MFTLKAILRLISALSYADITDCFLHFFRKASNRKQTLMEQTRHKTSKDTQEDRTFST